MTNEISFKSRVQCVEGKRQPKRHKLNSPFLRGQDKASSVPLIKTVLPVSVFTLCVM